MSYALQKRLEKNDLVYFEKCHTVGGMVLCQIGVLVVVQGSEYVHGESNSYYHFRFSPDRKFSYPG